MRIDILAIGSRGDVQPYVALALGLRSAGHRVRVVTLGGFEELVQGRGLDHLRIGDAPEQIANTSAGREWVKQRASVLGFLRGFVRVADSLIEDGMARYWRDCSDVEALIVSPMGLLVAEHIAERLRVPLIRAQLAPPVERTRYSWDGRANLATTMQGYLARSIDRAFHFLIWTKLRRSTNAARSKILELPALPLTAPLNARNRKPRLLLGAYSPAVAPPMPDWGDWIHVTGYWFLDDLSSWTPPRELADFLGSGSRPVFIGFGSTPFPQPEATTNMVVRAVTRAGHRGVVLAGGSGLATGRLSPEVLSVDSVPHEWLFSRVCAAVHHGGAGVTGAALRAGLPSVVVPVFADQPFWGKRVFQLGVGPPPIPAQRLTEDSLAKAIRATDSEQMRRRAEEIGTKIRWEDGVGRAVEIIDKHLGSGTLKAARHQHAY
jgi:sterol 3beta-glucosyltransferase